MKFSGQQNNFNTLNLPTFRKGFIVLDTQLVEGQKAKAEGYSLDYDLKFNNHRHRTVQCSPMHGSPTKDIKSCLPELHIGDNMKYKAKKLVQLNSKQSKNICILDSLIKLLKDDDEVEKTRKSDRNHINRALTEGSNEFRESSTQRKNKRPKIINNQVTRLLFEQPTKQRKLFSEEGSRKIVQLSEKLDSNTTFYKNKRGFELKIESPFQSKQQLQRFTQTKALLKRLK